MGNVRCSSSIVSLEGIGDKVLLSVFTDITRLVQAERAAKDASAQLDTIISNMNSGLTASTIGDRPHLVYANDRFYSMLGYTKEQFKSEVKLAYNLVCEEDRERVFEQVRGAVSSDGPESLTFRAIRRDGGTVWLQANVSTALFAGRKEPIQLTVFNDVTEEKRRSQEMAEITEQLMFLNGASKDMIASGDANIAINTVLAKVLDYFAAERAYIFEINGAGTHFSNTYEICADGVEPQKDNLQNLPRSAANYWFSYFNDHDYLCVDVNSIGEGREVERQVLAAQNIRALIAVPIKKDGKAAGFIGVDDPTRNATHTDRLAALGTYLAVLTARRDMTAKAQLDSEMMKHLMDDTPGGFARKQIMPDGSLVTRYVNEGLCRILGTTREEYMEHCSDGTMWGVHPDDAELVDKALKRVCAGEEAHSLQYRRQRKDGGWVWFLVSCRLTKAQLSKTAQIVR